MSNLDAELPQSLIGSDVDVRKHMLQALANSHLGHAAEAERNLGEAQRLCELSHCGIQGEVERIAGAIEAERDHAHEAETHFRRSLQLARQQGDEFLESSDLLNLGVVAIGNEHFDESVDWSNAATEVSHAVGAKLTEEKALGNLGWAYYKMGDFDKSLDFSVRATKSAQELGAVIDEVEWLNNQGLVYFQTGQFQLAENYYRQSLDLARPSQNQTQIIGALNALAFVSVKTGHFDPATGYSDEAFKLAQHLGDRPAELYAVLIQGQLAAQAKDGKRAVQLFTEVANDPKSDTSLRWEAQNNLAQLYESQNEFAAADKQYREALGTIESARSSLRHEEFRLPFLANAAHLYNNYVAFLIKQNKPQQALQIADYSRAQTLMEGLGLQPTSVSFRSPTTDARQVASSTNAVILFYWLGTEESYLWAITAKQTALFRLPGSSEIEDLLQRYRKALLGPGDVLQTENADGQKLYDALVAPAEKLIPPNSRVIIIPDGNLSNLNFETLLRNKPTLHYWIEDAIITNANSLRLLAAAPRPAVNHSPNLLLVGDALPATQQYGTLPNAAREMNEVQSHFAPASRQIFARAQATAPQYLASHPEQFSYLHFVAHGTASQLSPLDSAIVLSKSGNDDSFKLYARDIVQRPLHAELVTISSCYGQGARAYTGEGLVGLSWAFLRAGAHNVIGALWEVSDTSTPQLMDHLYTDLTHRTPPDRALRNAKLSFLHSEGVFRKPFYWAPFQLYTGF